jgi:predicted PurR-regulated permease PerM
MKKFIIPLVFFVLTGLSPVMANSSSSSVDKSIATNERKLSNKEAKQLVNRLKDIRDMDMNNLSDDQKRDLQKEVKDIKDNLKKNAGVVIYLSAAAIIIIILLILLL